MMWLLVFGFFTFASRIVTEGSEDRLLLIHVLYRHGDRSPVRTFKTNPINESHWVQGFGQLSQKGMHQQYDLGQFLRSRYIEGRPYKHLSTTYIRSEMHVRSTDYDRTLVSAYCNLAGLYPASGEQVWRLGTAWQPIPVHTVPCDNDTMLMCHHQCPKCDAIFQNEVQSDEIQKEELENKEFYAYINEVTGETYKGIQAAQVFDTLFCQHSHNFQLPDWVNTTFNGVTVYEKLNQLMSLNYKLAHRGLQSRLKGGPLLGKIIEDTRTKLDEINRRIVSPQKAFFYSAHDTTVAGLLGALKVFNNLPPPYTATVIVEMLERSDGDRYVQILYRNDSKVEPYTLQIPGCSSACPVEKFFHLVQDNIPDNWHEECQNLNGHAGQFFTVGAIVISLVAISLLILVVLFIRRRKCFRLARYGDVAVRYSQLSVNSD